MVASSTASKSAQSHPHAAVSAQVPAATQPKPTQPQPTQPSPPTSEAVPAESESGEASTPVHDLSTAEGLWNHACDVASRRGSDEALFIELQFDSGDHDRIRVRFKRPNTATAGFVQSNMDRVAAILREAAGRPLAVELAAPAQPPDAPERASLDPAITENPLVREALELFDATIHSVRRLPPVGIDEDSPENSSPGAQDDV